MKLFKRLICLALVAILCVGLVACGGSGKTDVSNPSSSEDTGSHRDPYKEETTEKVEMTDTDHEFDHEEVKWDGPEGYVIVVPAGNAQAKKSAVMLQDYYKAQDVTLQIVTDNTAPKAKEIIIGKTKRAESAKDLTEGQLEVSLKDGKLVFDGGHDVTADMAVGKFIQLKPNKEQAFTFKLDTDFTTTVFLDDYKYVWGDEFEGTDVDFTKWAFNAKMSAYVDAPISYDREITNVEEGRLKLRGIRCFDPENEKARFKMPVSVVTQWNMMYSFGYAEIRARMPFFTGAWPSFWTQSTSGLKAAADARKCQDYMVEIDVFEVFGSWEGEVVSTIHKWYNKSVYNYGEIHNVYDSDGNPVTHTGYTKPRKWWTAPNPDTINYEYHRYGYEWTPDHMRIYVDEEFIMEYDLNETTDLYDNMEGFRDPQFIIFNNHITSRAAGDAGHYTVGAIDDNLEMLPANYFIDYFRLYQVPGVGKIYIDDNVWRTYPDRK